MFRTFKEINRNHITDILKYSIEISTPDILWSKTLILIFWWIHLSDKGALNIVLKCLF